MKTVDHWKVPSHARAAAMIALCFGPIMTAACAPPDDRSAQIEVTSAGQLAIDSLQAAGDSIYRQDPDSAGELWAEARVLSERLQDSVRIARAITGLGQAAYQRGAFDTARALGEEALELKQRLRMSNELFRSYNSLGLIAWRQERLAAAVPLFDSATNAARALGDSLGVAKAMLNSGLVLKDNSQFEQSRATLSEARDRLLAEGDSANYGRALNNLGSLDIELGDLQSALVQLAAARRVFAATRDVTGELNARGQLATAYSALGDARSAFSVLDSAVALARERGDRADVAENLRIMADMYLEAGDAKFALSYYAQAAALNDSLGQAEQHATILRNQARAHRTAGSADVAYSNAREALAEHERGGFRYGEMKDRLLLAELAQQLGRSTEAQEHLRAARALAASVGISVAAGQVALVSAQISTARSQWADVIKELDAAAASIDLIGSDAVATRYALRARAEAQLGNRTRAIADGRAAVDAIERIRDRYDSGELRTTYIASKASVYAGQTLLLLEAKRDSEAFAVADAARGRAILEHLSSARASLQRDAGTRRLSEADQLLRRIDGLMARLRAREETTPRDRSPESVAMTRGLKDSLYQARSEFEALRSRNVESSAAARMISPPLATIRMIQASLVAGEVVVEYFATDRRLLIFVISPTAYRVIDQPVPADSIGARVYFARQLIGSRTSADNARPVLSALHTMLVAPVIASGMMKDARTMVVIPHGLLSYLPFAALVDPATNRFLVEDMAVLVAPSGAVLAAIRSLDRANGAANTRPAALVHALAPFTGDLPGSAAELRGIKQSVPTLRETVNDAASEGALRVILKNEAIVHLATHAVMNPDNPLFSRIDLAAGDGKSTDDNSRFEVHEILGLRVRSPLVFLSGCETALGSDWATRFEDREDLTSIAQAWLVAGARNVVATLWRIDDDAAAEFTSRFYRNVGNAGVPEALAIAQRAMIKDPALRRPYLWAAYQAIGDGRSPLSFAVGAGPENRAAKLTRVSVSR